MSANAINGFAEENGVRWEVKRADGSHICMLRVQKGFSRKLRQW